MEADQLFCWWWGKSGRDRGIKIDNFHIYMFRLIFSRTSASSFDEAHHGGTLENMDETMTFNTETGITDLVHEWHLAVDVYVVALKINASFHLL